MRKVPAHREAPWRLHKVPANRDAAAVAEDREAATKGPGNREAATKVPTDRETAVAEKTSAEKVPAGEAAVAENVQDVEAER